MVGSPLLRSGYGGGMTTVDSSDRTGGTFVDVFVSATIAAGGDCVYHCLVIRHCLAFRRVPLTDR